MEKTLGAVEGYFVEHKLSCWFKKATERETNVNSALLPNSIHITTITAFWMLREKLGIRFWILDSN
ncbi:uncharacterized protein ASCRUDRAFT_73442 [Ascoidea rubescens DSM 1968]|uniref:Uncharacterized protein n=1 Tax=Ascoidea rubescens DSM 1968 TaxID=1344418 RepID=A0A1D2VPT0_9ASCO|nr:hypothetical protein ASCRUDRAFT_73442 [Ascoidea rubescens DSM 1968]ODV63633.1 hypothetical protein ASCRUDRAFT_73442 [Ascoidea rubescens DSM 1968]